MTDLEKELIAEKLAQCVEAFADLKRYQAIGTIDYLRAHPDTYFAVCYRFIAAIESLFDIGQYLLATHALRAESQRDIPVLLVRAGIINQDLAERFQNMYGFRNRLVHAYGTLDDAKVADYLSRHLSDIGILLEKAKHALG
ncbi:MAG: DUF86 domain-containing protein [bacterium]|nr:DUF86 domain-containing protein [bacterium]